MPIAAFNHDFDDLINKLGEILPTDLVGKIEQSSRSDPTYTRAAPKLPRLSLTWPKATPTKSLSALEEDLDYLLELGGGEAIAHRGASIFHNFSDSDDDATPLLGSHQGPMIIPTPLGGLGCRKGMKSSKVLDLSLLLSATDSSELPF
jgi:hypothetical protein